MLVNNDDPDMDDDDDDDSTSILCWCGSCILIHIRVLLFRGASVDKDDGNFIMNDVEESNDHDKLVV